MTRSTALVFFGSDEFALPVLKGLLDAGYQIKLVLAAPPISHALAPVYDFSMRNKMTVLSPHSFGEIEINQLAQTVAEFAVLASYGKLLPQAALTQFKAIINVHPSLLPKWRGPSPVEAAILSGESETGVSLMRLIAQMDAGPIYAQDRVKLDGTENQSGLRRKLAEVGRDLLLDKLPEILAGTLQAEPQDETQVTYCRLLKKTDGLLDWSQPAEALERQIRAYADWPKSRSRLLDKDVVVTEAVVDSRQLVPGQVEAKDERILVGCGQHSLRITRLKPAGRAEMSTAEFVRGLKT